MKENNKLNDKQTDQVKGGSRFEHNRTCKRCKKHFIGYFNDDLCPECVEATKIVKTENGAYGGW